MKKLSKHFKIQPELLHISNAVNLNRFSKNMVSIFIPLIIIQRSSSLHEALQIIAGFYFLAAISKLVMNVPAMLLINRVGAPIILGFGFTVEAVSLGCLLGYTNSHALVFLAMGAVCLGSSDALADDARHVYISGSVQHEGISSSMATMSILGQAADVIGPLLGALIGTLLGASWLLIIALTLMSSSVIPLTKMETVDKSKHTDRPKFNLKGARPLDIFANICFTSDEAIGTQLWPIYLAAILGSFSSVGTVASIAAVVTMVTIWTAGHLGDKGHDHLVLRNGIPGVSLANAFRLVANTPILVGIASSAYSGTREFALNGLNSISYANARISGIQYVTSMQIACDIGYSSMWGLMLAVSLLIQTTSSFFNIAFIVAAVIIWGTPLIRRQNPHRLDNEVWGGMPTKAEDN